MIKTDVIRCALEESFAGSVIDVVHFKGEVTFIVDKRWIVQVCRTLCDAFGFNYCVDVCGADRFTDGKDRFEVIYNIVNISEGLRLRLKVFVDEDGLEVDTVTSIWSGSSWFEREVYDMFGVRFVAHPDLRRIYMPEDFEYFPLRKEFPLIGVPGSVPFPSIDVKSGC